VNGDTSILILLCREIAGFPVMPDSTDTQSLQSSGSPASMAKAGSRYAVNRTDRISDIQMDHPL
jgi:hypothetical protein